MLQTITLWSMLASGAAAAFLIWKGTGKIGSSLLSFLIFWGLPFLMALPEVAIFGAVTGRTKAETLAFLGPYASWMVLGNIALLWAYLIWQMWLPGDSEHKNVEMFNEKQFLGWRKHWQMCVIAGRPAIKWATIAVVAVLMIFFVTGAFDFMTSADAYIFPVLWLWVFGIMFYLKREKLHKASEITKPRL